MARARGPSAAFGSLIPAGEAAPAAGGAEALAPAGLDALLGAQESAAETVRDRAARRHGQETLKLLRALQRALLAGEADRAGLDQLAAQAAATPPADDSRLAAVQRAIAQRVAVELARHAIR